MRLERTTLNRHTWISCKRCGKRVRATRKGIEGWNIEAHRGIVFGFLCPGCQTPEENAEAEINSATLDYEGADAFGFLRARPKGGDAL